MAGVTRELLTAPMVGTVLMWWLLARFLWKAIEAVIDPKEEAASGEDVEVVWTAIKVFKWTGMNDYVALCEKDSVSFGGGYVVLRVRVWDFTDLVNCAPGKTVRLACTCLRRSSKGAVHSV
jgi:hypothetical protein